MKYFLLALLLFIGSLFVVSNVRAATLTVCATGCQYAGGNGLQAAVDAASDGDTILIQSGTYTRDVPTASTPFPQAGASGCFLNLKGKSLTLEGQGNPFGEFSGSVLFGHGHDQPYVLADPYQNRPGICSDGGSVTINNLHVKEFEGGCMKFFNTSVIINHSLVDGCDSGGVFVNSGSSLLVVDSVLMANPFSIYVGAQDTSISAISNTFYGNGVMIPCNVGLPSKFKFVDNIFQSGEFTISYGGIFSTCDQQTAQFKNADIKYNLVWKGNVNCYIHEYCDMYTPVKVPGGVNADPLFDVPANDQRGWRGWGGSFTLNSGSPATGAGDPSIPGTRDLGYLGGPCTGYNTAGCISFIAANKPAPPIPQAPTNTPVPTANPAFSPTPTLLPGQPTPTPTPNIFVNGNTGGYARSPLDEALISGDKATSDQEFGMKWMIYIVATFLYIMVIHFAMGIRKEFKVWIMVSIFAFGGFMGWYLGSLEAGYIFSVIFLFLFY